MIFEALLASVPRQDVGSVFRAEPVSPARESPDDSPRDSRPPGARPGQAAVEFRFSSQGRALAEREQGAFSGSSGGQADEESAPAPLGQEELSADESREVAEMRKRDREVRTHEQAHKSAGGSYAGSISLQYDMGPDGKRYAVAGSVPIDVSPVKNDPEATIRKMAVVRRAALAPASPSGADRSVAARAARAAQHARSQLAARRYSQTQELAAQQRQVEPQEGQPGSQGLPGPMGRRPTDPGDLQPPAPGGGGVQRLEQREADQMYLLSPRHSGFGAATSARSRATA